jgi:nucleoside triphosphate pyrophosphatase
MAQDVTVTGSSPIVLASSSPRRHQLLEMLHLPHRVLAPEVDESVRDGEAPERYVVRLARAKARAAVRQAPGQVVLAADTTVVLAGELFGKPADPEQAVAMLERLQGHTHQVMTAVAVARDERTEHALDVSHVTFRPTDRATLAAYVATGEPLDKAGAYAIQGLGAPLIERVEGDFFGVMGLPLRLALDLLERFGRPYRFTR